MVETWLERWRFTILSFCLFPVSKVFNPFNWGVWTYRQVVIVYKATMGLHPMYTHVCMCTGLERVASYLSLCDGRKGNTASGSDPNSIIMPIKPQISLDVLNSQLMQRSGDIKLRTLGLKWAGQHSHSHYSTTERKRERAIWEKTERGSETDDVRRVT